MQSRLLLVSLFLCEHDVLFVSLTYLTLRSIYYSSYCRGYSFLPLLLSSRCPQIFPDSKPLDVDADIQIYLRSIAVTALFLHISELYSHRSCCYLVMLVVVFWWTSRYLSYLMIDDEAASTCLELDTLYFSER